MALAILPILGALGGAIGGAVSGAVGDRTSSTSTSELVLGGQTIEERDAQRISSGQLTQLQNLVGSGAGKQDVMAGLGAQRDLATLLQQLQQTGGLPSAGQTQQAQGFAQQIFAPQQQALNLQFEQQRQQSAQQSALLGRGPTDPVLANRLAQSQGQQTGQLQAQQGAFSAQLGLQLPQQQLGFAQQRAGVLSGLGQQALSNRQALFGLGQQALLNERNLRVATGKRTGTNVQQSGGGLGGAITGGLAGLGGGFKAGSTLGSFGGFGGGGGGAGTAGASGFGGGQSFRLGAAAPAFVP